MSKKTRGQILPYLVHLSYIDFHIMANKGIKVNSQNIDKVKNEYQKQNLKTHPPFEVEMYMQNSTSGPNIMAQVKKSK